MSITPEEKQQAMNLGGSMRLLQTTIQRYHSEMVGPLIPEQASDQNQLADKEFVNSSITAATADPAKLGIGVGTCSTEAATQEKTVTLQDYQLKKNGFVAVTFENDVPANATLNVNGKGAKPIYYKGAAITAGTIKASDTVTFVYDGTNYVVASLGGSEVDGKLSLSGGTMTGDIDLATNKKSIMIATDTSWTNSDRPIPFSKNGVPGAINMWKEGFTFNPNTDVLNVGGNAVWHAGNAKGISNIAPIQRTSYMSTANARWTMLASAPSNTTSRYNYLSIIVSGLGYYYGAQKCGTYLIEMQTSSASVPSMKVTELTTRGSTGTVTFGYYIDSEAGKIYFGVHTSTRHNYIQANVIYRANTNINLLDTSIVLDAAPEGWTEIVTETLYGVKTDSVTGAVSIDGRIPIHALTATGNISGITLSTNPAAGHNCHVIITATAARTVVIAHDATNRVCPGAADVTLSIPANGYVEIDFLTANGKVYVRGV